MADAELPAGFVSFSVGRSEVVCANHIADSLREVLRATTLHEYAALHPTARTLVGRGIVYAVPLPGGVEQVVVRHNRHGGLFASFTGDLFLPPTRAPRELRISQRLLASGVHTPQILAYVSYLTVIGLRRVDVVSREVTDSSDLSYALMTGDPAARKRALSATADLINALSAASARHHDLNVKNVLLREHGGAASDALVLDVDRVSFVSNAAAARQGNLSRLLRSATKWQAERGAQVTSAELAAFAAAVRDVGVAPRMTLS